MSVDCFCIANPKPSLWHQFKRASLASCYSSPGSPFCLRLESLRRTECRRLPVVDDGVPPKGIAAIGLLAFPRKSLNSRSIVAFGAPHEESKSSDLEIEKDKNDLKRDQELEEAWEQMLASFKEQAMKLQSVSQEAYVVYSKKALAVLKETAVQLKIRADKARYDLSVIAKDLSMEGKQYLASAAENYPEPVKDVVETFASTDDLSDISVVRDFYIGIPYGAILFLGGFLNFMLTGSISAIRFGIILGGILLALSVSSLRSWRKREPSSLALNGQAVIAGILFLREIRLLSQGRSFASLVITMISGANQELDQSLLKRYVSCDPNAFEGTAA
ncbi:hypothetical protein Nepgr_031953 [Nepenthes gracilis]|uniref:Protein FATTY ACID EXPORT 3, chloroplastic n=1 Tax=Nepenthes gracilis TaxID=150966 RepID=A0AAD3THP5_NEPGR|nr:hypothetical protein Nepgr_031953 [Nepenthes gracilis]